MNMNMKETNEMNGMNGMNGLQVGPSADKRDVTIDLITKSSLACAVSTKVNAGQGVGYVSCAERTNDGDRNRSYEVTLIDGTKKTIQSSKERSKLVIKGARLIYKNINPLLLVSDEAQQDLSLQEDQDQVKKLLANETIYEMDELFLSYLDLHATVIPGVSLGVEYQTSLRSAAFAVVNTIQDGLAMFANSDNRKSKSWAIASGSICSLLSASGALTDEGIDHTAYVGTIAGCDFFADFTSADDKVFFGGEDATFVDVKKSEVTSIGIHSGTSGLVNWSDTSFGMTINPLDAIYFVDGDDEKRSQFVGTFSCDIDAVLASI